MHLLHTMCVTCSKFLRFDERKILGESNYQGFHYATLSIPAVTSCFLCTIFSALPIRTRHSLRLPHTARTEERCRKTDNTIALEELTARTEKTPEDVERRESTKENNRNIASSL
jgi:hypothetical protein